MRSLMIAVLGRTADPQDRSPDLGELIRALRLQFRWPLVLLMLSVCLIVMPETAVAQSSPFMTGATALETNLLAWLTPIAIILVMVLGGMAMANRLSWGWCFAAILGIAISFGAPQIVTWVRGLFGV